MIPNVMLCFDDEAMARMRGTPEYVVSKIFQKAKNDILDYLFRNNTSVFVLFDSMEKYPISNPTFGASMSGFLRAINRIDRSHNSIRIVFALPEELLPFFHGSSENLLKDFEKAFVLRWKPRDLLRIIAHRYRLFLSIHERSFYEELKLNEVNFHEGKGLSNFYRQFFSSNITNNLGIEESSIAYLIRHTQLLPRHFIMAFNHIARSSYKELQNWRKFSPNAIVDGVRSAEELIAEEILKPYNAIYNNITKNLNSVMGDLPPIFSYGDLHRRINRIKSNYQMTYNEMVEILFRMGVIGRICNDQKGGKYTNAEFFYNFSGNISFSGDDILCFHPIFSQYFKSNRKRNGDNRIIYPHGVSSEL